MTKMSAAWHKEYAQRNRARINAYNIEYRKDNPVRTMYQVARVRAKRQGIEFTIKLSDLPDTMPAKCPWLRIPLRLAYGKWNDNSPSLDRIDNRLGYVPGNVIIISMRANRIKTDATAEEVMRVGRGMKRALKNGQ